MNFKKSLNVVAAFLIFLGFGMIHGGSQWVEKTGSLLIGVGSLYLIVIVIQSIYFTNKEK
ncbi:MAG: hypothetical protein ACERKD_21305 [Prolixibacteraceae bacterium]